ncbi:MAG: PLP-dependent aminotransferase family protein [Cytobacillus gottheilii]|uniref:MocR-like pyridoxine biosynthesis transcription factor PdxR n=1 Tax=Cytobacillus gottheilii TaxID=859144 RepID=UPI0034647AF8
MILKDLNRQSSVTLTQQLYEQIRSLILNDELHEGERIFSTREVAGSLHISRNIVIEAYDRLLSEGYLEVIPKSGTFVAKGASIKAAKKGGSITPQGIMFEKQPTFIDFKGGNPAIDHFPRKKWAQLTKDVCLDAPSSIFGYGDPCGVLSLRKVLVNYLRRARGVICDHSQIVITSGATQALKLITELLVKKEDFIAVEDPVTDEMRNIFTNADASIYPVAADHEGIQPALLPERRPSFTFVIPSHQFPLGGTLTIQRRVQLLEYARKMDSYIVEDDYDSEFTYEGGSVPSIQGLDPDTVIYVGTFSKILSPALRIGYVVLPKPLIEPFYSLKWYSDRHTSSIEQYALARFIDEGHLDKHVRKMKKIYIERRKVLTDALHQAFPSVHVIGKAAGMHIVAQFPGITFTKELCEKLMGEGIKIYPVEHFALNKGSHGDKIVLGYGGITVEELKKGVEILKRNI